jgi:hypothetical protein
VQCCEEAFVVWKDVHDYNDFCLYMCEPQPRLEEKVQMRDIMMIKILIIYVILKSILTKLK